ncbi:PaaI family thioesterase [Veronia pacifica]|uniref:Thioesterase n=1 Tax=Veronia pacifica TaxID=1080227 RepID=A0A1C3EKV6_9GAMM|nr:PaaI family thioesterase [Veronia pacifica]ODA33866.1 thioesterase [Veronia pacifica]
MDGESHFRFLERMYSVAPVNAFYKPTMTISEGRAEIEIMASQQHHHSAGAVHGSVYFKMLDDAAYFAASSLEDEYFILTTSFTTYLTRPIVSGNMRAVGKVVNRSKSQIIAESVVYDSDDKEIGRGNGLFVRGRQRLAEIDVPDELNTYD